MRVASGEAATAAYMQSIRDDTPALTMFLREMPKGGDLSPESSRCRRSKRSSAHALRFSQSRPRLQRHRAISVSGSARPRSTTGFRADPDGIRDGAIRFTLGRPQPRDARRRTNLDARLPASHADDRLPSHFEASSIHFTLICATACLLSSRLMMKECRDRT